MKTVFHVALLIVCIFWSFFFSSTVQKYFIVLLYSPKSYSFLLSKMTPKGNSFLCYWFHVSRFQSVSCWVCHHDFPCLISFSGKWCLDIATCMSGQSSDLTLILHTIWSAARTAQKEVLGPHYCWSTCSTSRAKICLQL